LRATSQRKSVSAGNYACPAWLEAELVTFRPDGLPDPLEYVGRHRRWVVVAGVPVRHQDWTATHEGECPAGCQPYKRLFHAPVTGRRIVRKPRKPRSQEVAGPVFKPLAFDFNDPYR
jgi:hypothetical protein